MGSLQQLLQVGGINTKQACPSQLHAGVQGCTSSRAECTLQDRVCSRARLGTAIPLSLASHRKCSARLLCSGRLHSH